jgi:hypothetical protein
LQLVKAGTEFTDAEAAAYLAALVDGEGCISFSLLKSGASAGDVRRVIVIGMTDKPIIDLAAALYDRFGIRYTRHDRQPKGNRKHVWVISIQARAGIERFAEIVPIQHPAKREKLTAILAGYRPMACLRCGAPLEQRTRGCSACQDRHKMRRRAKTLPAATGETGRPLKGAPRVYGGA